MFYLKQQTVLILTLVSKRNPFSARLLTTLIITSKIIISIIAARISKEAGY
jgi:hypothetical protein